jgi:23S rRNA A2030 N6-methylase RlmJ
MEGVAVSTNNGMVVVTFSKQRWPTSIVITWYYIVRLYTSRRISMKITLYKIKTILDKQKELQT